MTTIESFRAAKAELIEKINNVPETLTTTNMDTFNDYTITTASAKAELVAKVEALDTFTPALQPSQIYDALVLSSDASDVLDSIR